MNNAATIVARIAQAQANIAAAGEIPHAVDEIAKLEAAAADVDVTEEERLEATARLAVAKLANQQWAQKIALGRQLMAIEGADFADAKGSPAFPEAELALFPQDVRDMLDLAVAVNIGGGRAGYKFKENVWNAAGAATTPQERAAALVKAKSSIKAEHERRKREVENPETSRLAAGRINLPPALQEQLGMKKVDLGAVQAPEQGNLVAAGQADPGLFGFLERMIKANPEQAGKILSVAVDGSVGGLTRIMDLFDAKGRENRMELQRAALALGAKSGGRRNMRRRTMNRKNAKRSTRRRRNTRRNY